MPREKDEEQEKGTFEQVIEAVDAMEVEEERHLSVMLDRSIRDAIRAAQSSGTPASVTMVIKIKPSEGRRLSFLASVNAKLPRPPVSGVVLYADEAGHVHRSDPQQGRLPFSGPTPIRKNEA